MQVILAESAGFLLWREARCGAGAADRGGDGRLLDAGRPDSQRPCGA